MFNFDRFKKEVKVSERTSKELEKMNLSEQDLAEVKAALESIERPFQGLRAIIKGDSPLEGGLLSRRIGEWSVVYRQEPTCTLICYVGRIKKEGG